MLILLKISADRRNSGGTLLATPRESPAAPLQRLRELQPTGSCKQLPPDVDPVRAIFDRIED
jgi:hypothetical protein